MGSGCLSGEKLSGWPQGHGCRTPRPRKQAFQVTAAGSTYGTNFRVTTFGESHGKGVGCVIDGVPPRLPITQEEIQVLLHILTVSMQQILRVCT